VVSVTSEVLANASVQSASARSARPDPSPPASFAALIDSNVGQSDNRAQASSQANSQDNSQAASQAPAPRRADDSQGPSDNRSRDTSSASDNPPRNDSNDRGTVNADASAKADAPGAKSKDASKSSDTKPDDAKDASAKSASGDASATDQTAKQDATAAVTANAIAVTIAAPAAPAGMSPAAPATDQAAAPLAIAAAGIAASAAVVNATAPGAATADTGTAAAATANATKADGTKTDAQAAVGAAVTAQATTADTTATAGVALAASTSAKLPAAPKDATPIKTTKVVKEGITTTAGNTADTSATATGDATAIAPAGTAQAAAGKPKAENGIVDAVKADASGNAAPAANAAHGHTATADAGQTLANTSGNGALGAGFIQAQQPSAITTPVTAAQLTATAATSTAVPLSGVAMEIAASAKSGKSSFEIRLDPADLGRIDVRIDVDRNGQVTSHLTVEKPETLSMLRQDAPQLQRALDDAGFKTDGGGLQFSLRDQSSSGQNSGNDTGRNAQRLVISEDDSMPATAIAGRSYGRMLGSSSGVDIRV
jgi:flagellar hook-length control protein FliK